MKEKQIRKSKKKDKDEVNKQRIGGMMEQKMEEGTQER
jgi:hypothetical protein